jgi:poly-gamma-glutamate capsule biosynthesis protein CapA/YwtB (metallophosphatase superfamily)
VSGAVRLLVAVLVLVAALATLSGAARARAPAEAQGAIRISAVGDIAMAPSSDRGSRFFQGVRTALRDDVVLGNLEGTLATGGASKCSASSSNCYAFRAPPAYARVLRKAGFTIVNLANNHALDYGATGQVQTVAALDRAGLRHTGRPGEIAYLRDGDTRIAVLGFAPYRWAQSLLDLAAAARLVRTAASRADVVVVTMHAGAEGASHDHVRPGTETFLGENRGDAIAFSHAVVRAGADLVVGSGPHVLRGMEWYRGRLIAYSVGNFLGNGTLSLAGPDGVSAVLRVGLRRNGSWARGRLVPVRLAPPGVPVLDGTRAALGEVRSLSREDFGRNAMRVDRSGNLQPPARRTG